MVGRRPVTAEGKREEVDEDEDMKMVFAKFPLPHRVASGIDTRPLAGDSLRGSLRGLKMVVRTIPAVIITG